MAETKVKERYIGSSFKFQIVLPINFADCLEIEANVQSMNTDKQVISKNKKTATEGYKTLVVDTINPKAVWVYVEASESDKAFENLYECHLMIRFTDTTYPSGIREINKKFPCVKFKSI